MVTLTYAQAYQKIFSLFNCPIAASSGSTSNYYWTPTKFENQFIWAYLFNAAGVPTPKAGYKRVDCGLSQTLAISYAAQNRRHSITESKANFPRSYTSGTLQFGDTGNHQMRYWFIPRDSYSDSTWIAYITAINAGTDTKLPMYFGRQNSLRPVYLNDLSQTITPFYRPSRPQGRSP